MSANREATAPTGRRKLSQRKARSAIAVSHEGAVRGRELPDGWQWKTIPNLLSDNGVFIDGDWVESKDQDPAGDVRLIQLADVGDGVYRDKSDRFMTKAKAEELRCTFLKKGDVLIARMPDPLGRACIFPGDAKPSVTVVDVAIVRSGNGEFDHRWLACFVNAHPFRSAIAGLQAGSTRKRISRGNLATISLPVPPLPVQRRIVAEIEKQFTRLEAGVSALSRVQANLKRYRAAVLKAACEGRLVPTEAELAKIRVRKAKHGTGEELLAHILAERRQKWQGRGQFREPAAPDTTKLQPLPEGWTWVTLDALSEIKGGITKDQNRKHAAPARSVPYLRVANVQRGYLDLAEVKEIVTTEGEIQELALQPGDILFNEGGDRDKLGRGWVWNGELPECIHQNHVFRARLFDPMLNPKLISWYANTFGQKFFFDEGKHTTNLASISMSKLKGLPVPIPPPDEQTRIVAEVERRLSVVKEVETVVAANLQRASRLRESILQAAFSGELIS